MDKNRFYEEVQRVLETITNDIFDYEAAYTEAQAAVSSDQYYPHRIPDDEIEAFEAPVSIFANNAAFTEEIIRQLRVTLNP